MDDANIFASLGVLAVNQDDINAKVQRSIDAQSELKDVEQRNARVARDVHRLKKE